jgi:RNA polymerase sigma-70 factor (ECF subfamily)
MSADADESLADLYRRHWAELVRFVARSFGPGPPEPEDVAQAAFAQYGALEKTESVGNPRAFLYRSARNFAVDQKRRMNVRARFAASADAAHLYESADELDAERVLGAKERLRILDRAVRGLEPRARQALVLHRIHDLSYAEIARQTGMSQTQVKRLVALALLACERALREADGQ